MMETYKLNDYRKSASAMVDRFWKIAKSNPDTLKGYAKKMGISYVPFCDFVFGRSILQPKFYIKFENWVIQQENEGKE